MAGPLVGPTLDGTFVKTLSVWLGSVNVGTTISRAIWTPQNPGQIVNAWMSDDAGITLGTATYPLISLKNGTTTMASISSSAVPITVDVMNAFQLNTTIASTKFASGDTILLAVTPTPAGVGSTITNAFIQIDYIPGTYNA